MKKLLLTTLLLTGCGGSTPEKEAEIVTPPKQTNKLCVIFNNPAEGTYYDKMSAIVYPDNQDSVSLTYDKNYQQYASLIELEQDSNAYIDMILGWTTEINYMEIDITNGEHITFITFYPGIDLKKNQFVNYTIIESITDKCENKKWK